MKKTTQKEIARYVGVSPQFICDIKKKRRSFGKKNAIRISKMTEIPYEYLNTKKGKGVLDELRTAYSKRGEKAK